MIREVGADVYAISYPGQDGAKRHAHVDRLFGQVALAMSRVSSAAHCGVRRSVFVGRWLGATVALAEAVKFRPRGVLVDGPASAVNGWRLLPVRALLGRRDYAATSLLQQMPSVQVSIFQGTADTVTRHALTRIVVQGRSNVTFETVGGGTHHDTYLLAGGAYVRSLRSLLDEETLRSR